MRQLQLTELGRVDAETFKKQQKIPVVAVLDNIRSLNNIGSFFRSADAFALEGLILCGYTGQPPAPEIRKSALGAEEVVAWKHFPTTVEALDYLSERGYQLLAVEQTDASISLNQIGSFDQPTALIFGNEVHGVAPEVLNRVDGAIEIPQQGTKHSLNVSVCAGIVFWKYFELYHAKKES
jgi:tRNA G18 (ribose-2'-O)-methylase SpoU